MGGKKVSNIREFIWKTIDTDISTKKNLSRGLINIRSLAKHIIETQKINASLDSVISAIRRYNFNPKKEEETHSVYYVLKQAKISTRTKMASLLLKRADEVKTKIDSLIKIALYLEGYKKGKGDILPLGVHDLEQLWDVIEILKRPIEFSGSTNEKDDKDPLYYE